MSRKFVIDPAHAEQFDACSPAQKAIVLDMMVNHERVQYFVSMLTPKNPLIDVKLKMSGMSRDDVWMILVDQIAKMSPAQFDALLIEFNHYIKLGMAAESAPENPAEIGDPPSAPNEVNGNSPEYSGAR